MIGRLGFRLLIHLTYTTAAAMITARAPRADNEPMTDVLGDEEPLLDGEIEHGMYKQLIMNKISYNNDLLEYFNIQI